MEDAQTPDADMVKEYFPNDKDGWLYKMQPWFEFGPFPSGASTPFSNDSWCDLMPYTTTGGVKKPARYRYMFEIRRSPTSKNTFQGRSSQPSGRRYPSVITVRPRLVRMISA